MLAQSIIPEQLTKINQANNQLIHNINMGNRATTKKSPESQPLSSEGLPKVILLSVLAILLLGWSAYFINLFIRKSQRNIYYGVGTNKDFEIGVDSVNKKISNPEQLYLGGDIAKEKIVKVAGGNGYSMFLTDEGELWGIGSNSYGQIQPKDDTKLFYSAVKLNLDLQEGEKIIEVDSAFHHNLAITDKNRVVAWGSNSTGQLGTDVFADKLKVINLDKSKKYKAISAGWRHSAVLTDSGEIFAWGGICTFDKEVQLEHLRVESLGGCTGSASIDEAGINDCNNTLDTTFIKTITPTKIGDDKTFFSKVDLGHGHIVALSLNGDVFTSGSNLFGQLGRGNRDTTQSNLDFKKSDSLSGNIKDISAGYRNTFILNNRGKVSYVGVDFDDITNISPLQSSPYNLETAQKLKAKLEPAEIMSDSKAIFANQDVLLSLKNDSTKVEVLGRLNWLDTSKDVRSIIFPKNIKKIIVTPNKIISI